MTQRALATVDVAAIAANVARLRRELEDGVRLCAVVKADAYGHGVAHAVAGTREGGAHWLATATAVEAAEVREIAGPNPRILVLGVTTREEAGIALDADADLTVWDEGFLASLPSSARVHVKLDSGMGRLGTRDADLATRLADSAAERGMLEGLTTHFATADERGDAFFGEQLARFGAWVAPLRERHHEAIVHAANSAATLRDRAAHFDMVRPGVALYGLDPFGEDAAARELRPALRLTSWVGAVKPVAPGQSAGYGRRFVAERDSVIATVPIGYGDGWRRALTNNADVLIGGRRYPLVGTVSMDNITVDLGPDGGGVQVGDEVVLLGDDVSAEEIARRLGTINYEVTCGLLPRVPRVAV
ncbi:MAG TPA: alanine racemase [Solirubrobacteraceae bacterium]